jgi:hypothetical protein
MKTLGVTSETTMKHLRIPLVRICVLTCACVAAAVPAHASTTWLWNYAGTGVTASGTLSTADTPDAAGFYQIVSITGSRNGDTITGLFPTGSAIPGNEPFVIDNLIRMDGPGQLTVEGFGYSLASGAYANPYYADFLSPPSYSEVFTSPCGGDRRPGDASTFARAGPLRQIAQAGPRFRSDPASAPGS